MDENGSVNDCGGMCYYHY